MRFLLLLPVLMLGTAAEAWGTAWGESGSAQFLQDGSGPLGDCLPEQFVSWGQTSPQDQQETLACLVGMSENGQVNPDFAQFVYNWQGPQNVYVEVAYVYLDFVL